MKKRLFIAVLTVMLSGCVTTSGPVNVGVNQYMMTKQSDWALGGSLVVVELVQEGKAFCAKEGRQFSLIDSAYKDHPSSGMITFRCDPKTRR